MAGAGLLGLTASGHGFGATVASEILAPKWSAYCHPYENGTSTIEVSWPLSQHHLSAPFLLQRTYAQQVLMTAYRDGFTTGRYVSLSNVLSPSAAFAPSAHAPPGSSLAALKGLHLVDIATSSQRPSAPLQLSANTWALSVGKAHTLGLDRSTVLPSVTVRIEGLLPGIRYTVRIPAGPNSVYSSPTEFAFTAPSCPRDRAAQERK
jgi:hypothetical protein